MITLDAVYGLAGLMLAGFAVSSVRDGADPRRWRNAGFWGLLAVSFLAGDRIGDFANGLLVLGLAGLAVAGLGRGTVESAGPEARAASAVRLGNRLFLLALIVPGVTLFGTVVLARLVIGGVPLVDPAQATLVSLGLGAAGALAVILAWFRLPPRAAIDAGRRLADQVGWAGILPQLLAALGTVFAAAGTGHEIAEVIGRFVALEGRLSAVAAYTVGMALMTALLGNGFAAFPVMTAAIGLPLIVQRDGGDPAVVAALGMLSGFCGTLATPMAANFNIVPVSLLGLANRYSIIRAQLPTALALLIGNTLLMYLLAFSGHSR